MHTMVDCGRHQYKVRRMNLVTNFYALISSYHRFMSRKTMHVCLYVPYNNVLVAWVGSEDHNVSQFVHILYTYIHNYVHA